MSLPKSWNTLLRIALLGLAVAAASYAYAAFYDYSQPPLGRDVVLGLLSLLLCPPQLLFAFCIDCEVVGWNGFIQYAIVGVLNAALYTIIALPFVMSRNASK